MTSTAMLCVLLHYKCLALSRAYWRWKADIVTEEKGRLEYIRPGPERLEVRLKKISNQALSLTSEASQIHTQHEW
jgi:hypothetical protein